jgi:hypothetical protein
MEREGATFNALCAGAVRTKHRRTRVLHQCQRTTSAVGPRLDAAGSWLNCNLTIDVRRKNNDVANAISAWMAGKGRRYRYEMKGSSSEYQSPKSGR